MVPAKSATPPPRGMGFLFRRLALGWSTSPSLARTILTGGTRKSTSPAANASSAGAGAEAGQSVELSNAPFYYSSTAASPSCYKSGTFYFYDGILINGRYRITNSEARCGKLPVGENCTGWVPASYCTGGGDESSTGGGGGGQNVNLAR